MIIRCNDFMDKVPEFGMRLLNARLRSAWPDYEILHLSQGCSYSWVTV